MLLQTRRRLVGLGHRLGKVELVEDGSQLPEGDRFAYHVTTKEDLSLEQLDKDCKERCLELV